ncbi:hypothetical protein GW796_10675 [archaeon]|nr:hypothetical protein [archaeon]NCQ52326.1 hypothetical protein [archaeon]
MKKLKNKNLIYFKLDLSDAIMPNNWPKEVPMILSLCSGKYQKDFDIIPKTESWYTSLLEFLKIGNDIPIGLSKNRLPIGSKVFDETNNIVCQGEDKNLYLKKIKKQNNDKENILKLLRIKFTGIKDCFLVDFNETVELLMNGSRPFKTLTSVYDVFNDVFISAGGSTYQDNKSAALGAYNSIIDFNALKTTLNLFTKEEKILLREYLVEISCLSPIFKVLEGQIELDVNREDKTNKKRV